MLKKYISPFGPEMNLISQWIYPDGTPFTMPPCAHHWLVELARGVTSKATCKKCGAVKEFYNSAEAAPRGTINPLLTGNRKFTQEMFVKRG